VLFCVAFWVALRTVVLSFAEAILKTFFGLETGVGIETVVARLSADRLHCPEPTSRLLQRQLTG
jgi:hypothetical protein